MGASGFVVREISGHTSRVHRRVSVCGNYCETRFSSSRQSVLLAGGISSAVKSARAPRRLENVKDHRAMFYLDGRDGTAAKYGSSSPDGEENFGWWLSDQEIAVSPRSYHVKRHRSPESFASMLSCSDSDDSDGCSFARDVSMQEQENEIRENIELISFTRDDLDIDLIERDARETVSVMTSYLLICERSHRALESPTWSRPKGSLNLKLVLI